MVQTGVQLGPGWNVLNTQLERGVTLTPELLNDMTRELAFEIQDHIKIMILSGGASGPRGRHPLTTDKRGPGSALYDSGDMYHNLKVKKEGDAAYAIGWDRPEDSQKVLSNEFGATIPVTPAMRSWFAGQGYPLKGSTRFIRIPARPFVRPGVENALASSEVGELFDTLFIGIFGT